MKVAMKDWRWCVRCGSCRVVIHLVGLWLHVVLWQVGSDVSEVPGELVYVGACPPWIVPSDHEDRYVDWTGVG